MPKASPRSRGATELAATPLAAAASTGAYSFLTDAVAGLDVQLHALANELAREILTRELDRRLGDRKDRRAPAALVEKTPKRRGRPPKDPAARQGGKVSSAASSAAASSQKQSQSQQSQSQQSQQSQLALQLSATAAPVEQKPAEPARTAAVSLVPELPLTSSGKRIAWNRDTVVNALVPYVTKRMEVDTSFLKRHGPKGLVPAAIRFFGRLPAAINVACLRAAELTKQQEAAAAAQES